MHCTIFGVAANRKARTMIDLDPEYPPENDWPTMLLWLLTYAPDGWDGSSVMRELTDLGDQ